MSDTRDDSTGGAARGFTLIEVLVASVLFAIGMLAAMAMQYTALGGFGNARDVTNASKVGKRVVDLLKAESQQWRSGQTPTTSAVYNDDAEGDSDNETNTSFNDPVLGGLTWNWQQVFTRPVDVRLTDAGPRRFCTYVRGGTMGNTEGVLQLQVAVVYPAGSAGGFTGECPEAEVTDHLNPETSPPEIEVETGYRAVYTGGTLVQRGYLDFWGSS